MIIAKVNIFVHWKISTERGEPAPATSSNGAPALSQPTVGARNRFRAPAGRQTPATTAAPAAGEQPARPSNIADRFNLRRRGGARTGQAGQPAATTEAAAPSAEEEAEEGVTKADHDGSASPAAETTASPATLATRPTRCGSGVTDRG